MIFGVNYFGQAYTEESVVPPVITVISSTIRTLVAGATGRREAVGATGGTGLAGAIGRREVVGATGKTLTLGSTGRTF